jgi:hypothetical protein
MDDRVFGILETGLTPDAAEDDVGYICEFATTGIHVVGFLDRERGGYLGPRADAGESTIAVVGGIAELTFLRGEGIHELAGFGVQDLEWYQNAVGLEAAVGAFAGSPFSRFFVFVSTDGAAFAFT